MIEEFVVDVSGSKVSARDYRVADPWAWCVLGHGAGAPHTSAFMVSTARLLVECGVQTITFNFPYMEARRKMPDRAPVLESCFGRAIAVGRDRVPTDLPLFIGGKSLGGRMATHLAAQSRTPDAGRLDGVVCLGYPLHPPGRPDHLRTLHLPRIRVPLLFVQGTRDTFGGPDELREAFPVMPEGSRILEVPGGDHSFKSPQTARATEEQRLAPLVTDIGEWMRGIVDRGPQTVHPANDE